MVSGMLVFFGLVLLSIVVGVFIELRRAKDKKRCLIKNVLIVALVAAVLFLFGPFFLISPIKLGYTTVREGAVTIVYPNKLALEADRFHETVKEAMENVGSFYGVAIPTRFLLANSKFDMLRFGNPPVAGGAGGPFGICIRKDRVDEGVITHELSHRYLQETTGRISTFFPRWFDEGLATYLGHTGYMSRYTDEGVLKDSLEEGLYQRDLSYWHGLLGQLRWSFIDCYRRPVGVYTQAYFLVHYLVEEYGESQLERFLSECKTGKSFEVAFREVFGISVADFHQEFLQNWELQ